METHSNSSDRETPELLAWRARHRELEREAALLQGRARAQLRVAADIAAILTRALGQMSVECGFRTSGVPPYLQAALEQARREEETARANSIAVHNNTSEAIWSHLRTLRVPDDWPAEWSEDLCAGHPAPLGVLTVIPASSSDRR